jgi:S-adenosylmethionine hydrolase
MQSMSGKNNVLLHYWCDFSSETVDFTFAQALLYSHFPDSKIVFSPLKNKKGNTRESAIILKQWVHDFPPGFLHICHLSIISTEPPRYMITQYRDQIFIGPDNGFMQLAFEDESLSYYIVPNHSDNWNILKDVFIPCIKTIYENPERSLSELFKPKENLSRPLWIQPIIKGNTIRINCMYVDVYGNCYFNLNREMFERLRQGRSAVIKSQVFQIKSISKDYNDMPEGKILALFGQGNLLQIAQNGGNCSTFTGIYVDTPILIEFHEN